MALVVVGETPCTLCGKAIRDVAEAVSFPPFIPPQHRLAKYSDAVFHRTCYEEFEDREALDRLYRRYVQIWESRPAGLVGSAQVEEWGREAFKRLLEEH